MEGQMNTEKLMKKDAIVVVISLTLSPYGLYTKYIHRSPFPWLICNVKPHSKLHYFIQWYPLIKKKCILIGMFFVFTIDAYVLLYTGIRHSLPLEEYFTRFACCTHQTDAGNGLTFRLYSYQRCY